MRLSCWILCLRASNAFCLQVSLTVGDVRALETRLGAEDIRTAEALR
jgi:hypothetical protein